MSKKLVAYFSASGVTARVAGMLADAVGADIHEIRPKFPYSKADLNWMNKQSRSTIEMNNKAFRPEIEHSDLNVEAYDVFPSFFCSCVLTSTRGNEFSNRFYF